MRKRTLPYALPHALPRVLPWVAAIGALVLGVSGCATPSHHFVTSASDDVVIRVPSGWTVVRSGAPAQADGTAATDGSWVGVYDSASTPNASHAAADTVPQPVAVARTWVVTKESGATVTDDQLRDIVLPVSSTARSAASASATAKTFALISDESITTKTAHGVRVIFSYDLGKGVEVFDQVAVTNKAKTAVHLFVVHCSQSCWNTNKQSITAAVNSFTVKVP